MEYDVIIIGTTIDRITSAIYLIKSGKKVLIIENNNLKEYVLKFEDIKDYTLKKYVSLNRWKNEIISYGGTIKDEEIIEIKKGEVITDKGTYSAKAIIVATGKRHKLIGLDNEEKYFGNGIHFCVKCDAPFYKGEIGCVVGGNDYALENALNLSNICKEVIVIDENNELRANELLIKELLEKNNIKIYYNTEINKIIGDRRLRKIVLNNCKELNVDCVFISKGFIANVGIIDKNNNINKEIGIFVVDNNEVEKDEDDGIKIAIKTIEYINNLK